LKQLNKITINKKTTQTKIINGYLKEGIEKEPKKKQN
jgi:hypothetical protein